MSRMLVEKWSKAPGTLSIANIQDTYIKDNLAILLENQRQKDLGKELFMETTFGTVAGGVSVGNTPAGNIPQGGAGNGVFAPISMALVRRTFPALFANKVVGVQAMSTPVGLAYAIRYLYGKNTDGNLTPKVEAGWDKVPEYSGFTGGDTAFDFSMSNLTGITTGVQVGSPGIGEAQLKAVVAKLAGEAAPTQTAEMWQGFGTGTDYPELTFQIDRQPIEAKTRKLATSFSLEAAMDVKAMHDIEVERELINMIQYELVAEQDRELLQRMIRASLNKGKALTSDGNLLNIDAGGADPIIFDVTQSDGRWSQEKFATILSAIVSQANEIAIKTRRGAGNFAVVSPRVATALQSAGPGFSRLTANVDASTVFPEIGTINESIKVYRDQYAGDSDYALVGYKGPGISDSGIIYSPYVTGLVSRTVSPSDFSPRIGIMSRYAITDTLLGSGRYYRLIVFNGLDALLHGQTNSLAQAIKVGTTVTP